jgi:hypothetical protein
MIAPFLRLLAILGILCGVALPAAGQACTPPADYRVPTNFELVQQADLIVLALVIAGPELPDGKPGAVQIAPMEVLKGVLPAEPVGLSGTVGGVQGDYEAAPTPLTAAHYSTRDSARCTRQIYAKGNLVLALFRKTDQGFRPIDAPLARAVEDVESFDSLWLRTAKRYVALQAQASGDALRDAVIAERDRLSDHMPALDAEAVEYDLRQWLATKSIAKPRGDLHDNIEVERARWAYDDRPDAVSVVASGAGAMTCRRDAKAISLEFGGASRAAKVTLVINGRRVAAEPGARADSGPQIALTPEFDRLLRQSDGPYAVMVDDKPVYRGLAGDVLQKFAMRCETLLRP